MSRFAIGQQADGGDLWCDLDVLVNSRLLVQANSGAGKSWCLRRILEQTHGRVQHLVIDPEGEFSSLRERFDYVLAGQGGETVAHPRTARLLAERLLELRVSAVMDIYELKHHERVDFVKIFLETLINAPKKLWHQALVVLDEAHVFAPEKGSAESSGAVIDLATRGRKRGFCAVLATQRLSKLNKDAAAECNNKLIGRAALDVDMDRAGEELGFPKSERQQLRKLDAGDFFAFGPAISRTVVAVRVGPVSTTHPKAGGRLAFAPPPPTAKIKALLPKLADLPAEAEQKAKTEAELRTEISTLKRQLSAGPTPPAVKNREVPILKDGQISRLEKMGERMEAARSYAAGAVSGWRADVEEAIGKFAKVNADTVKLGQDLLDAVRSARNGHEKSLPGPVLSVFSADHKVKPPLVRRDPSVARVEKNVTERLLAALATHSILTHRKLAMLARVKRGGSTWRAGMAKLRSEGWITEQGEDTTITEKGRAHAGDLEALPTGEALIKHWRAILKGGATLRVFDFLVSVQPKAVTPEALAEKCGFELGGSTMRGALAKLRGFELIPKNELRASDELFS